MARSPLFRVSFVHGALFGVFLAASACTEPVDCQSEPQRCPNFKPATAAPQRVQVQVPTPGAGGQRFLNAPLDPGALGRQPSREPLALDPRMLPKVAAATGEAQKDGAQKDAALPQGTPTRAELDAIIATLQLPIQGRDFEGLKPFITQRLYDTLTPLLVKDGNRLWQHLAKYQTASKSGYRLEADGVEAGGAGAERARMHVTLPDGGEMRPILVKQNGIWKVDRF